MLSFIGNVFTVMFLWGLFTFTMYAIRVRKTLRKYKDNPDIKGVQIVNGQVHVIEKDQVIIDADIKEETKDMVYDSICNEEIEKSSAYHIIRDGVSHYFCSWECREKFLQETE